jgi:hypothetical protein
VGKKIMKSIEMFIGEVLLLDLRFKNKQGDDVLCPNTKGSYWHLSAQDTNVATLNPTDIPLMAQLVSNGYPGEVEVSFRVNGVRDTLRVKIIDDRLLETVSEIEILATINR